ncbi:MAG: ZIP family metal transporter [Candidatus Woesearchaeota archaeon]
MDPLILIVMISAIGPIAGSFIGVMLKTNDRFIYNLLSFAAGMMLTISFLDLIPEAIEMSSLVMTVLGILSGAVIMYLLDRFLPHFHPDPLHSDEMCCVSGNKNVKEHSLDRTSRYLIAGIFFHNLPEGMAIAAMQDPSTSIAVALAIAVHNIPEGICTSAPYFHVTKNRLKAFLLSASTAIPVLLGFFVARILFTTVPMWLIGFTAATAAGLMIYISVDELIPSSCKRISTYSTVFSLIFGIVAVILLETLH